MVDTWLDLNTINLLGRVDSRINKDKLLKNLVKAYALGSIDGYHQIHEGFEDYNIKLTTSKGIYLVKLFSQYKSFRHVKDNIAGLVAFYNAGVHVPKLLKTKKREYLYYYEDGKAMALGCVMEFFNGKSFLKYKTEPTKNEIKRLIKDIYKINTTKFKPKGIYDVWVLQNLPLEFEKKFQFLSKHDYKLMLPIVKKVKKFNFSKLTKGPIHNDIQRSNVLKNKDGEMCIIDFSVMEYHAISIELATFIALFCINSFISTVGQAKSMIKFVVTEYQKYKKLTKKDITMIPYFIKATYAANCLGGSFELRGKGNDTEETRYWIKLGSKGMELMRRLKNL